jgi:hypothetical protein
MQAMDGWEFHAEQLREPAMASIPVVIVSLEGLLGQDETLPPAVFPKPVGWGHLLEKDHRAAERARERTRARRSSTAQPTPGTRGRRRASRK